MFHSTLNRTCTTSVFHTRHCALLLSLSRHEDDVALLEAIVICLTQMVPLLDEVCVCVFVSMDGGHFSCCYYFTYTTKLPIVHVCF